VQFTTPAVDDKGNTITTWYWNFGDGTTNNDHAQNQLHTYTNNGPFFPSLVAINNNGDSIIGSGPVIDVVYPSSILNGGFETGTFTNWTQNGGSDTVVSTSPYVHSGTYGAKLKTLNGTLGFLSQTLTTIPGAAYSISFWMEYSPVVGRNNPNEFHVSWNGNMLFDETNVMTAINWTNIQLTATATSTTTTLQFGFRNDFFDFGLDDISVSAATQLGIANISLSGANLVLNGTGGQSGRTYYVLMGTNVTEPFNQWTPVATNLSGADGNFSITATNAVNANDPQRFYILQLQ
jgi:hypothetical protein